MDILIIDDEPLFREGVKTVLARTPDLKVVAEAGTARAGFSAIDQGNPDVVLLDLLLPGMDGISAAREVKRRSPKTKILMLSGHHSTRDVREALAAGAMGYGMKTDPVETLIEGIRKVGRGERYISPSVHHPAVEGVSTHGATREPGDVLAALSIREREVFDLVVRGFSNQQIARELCVSYKTVDTHRQRIYEKLGCHSSADVVRFAAHNGLLRETPTLRNPGPDGAGDVAASPGGG